MTHVNRLYIFQAYHKFNLKYKYLSHFKTMGEKKQNTLERWTTDITYISKENLRSCVSEKLHETFLIPTPCAKIA